MAEVASAYVSLLPSANGFGMQIDRQIGPDIDKAGKSGGKRFGGAFGKVVGPAMGLLAVGAVTGLLKDSIGEAREAQKVGALTVNTIKQTGGVANVSAKQVGALATAISLKSGIDDEAIQSGANLLLTFKNVQNEAGKGAKIFDRATKAAVDLSAAGFGDLSGTSKQLGKALNDPVKGISALSRAGVTFTEGQKKQIKSMVKNNDLLGAQKIILKEVESQVGGSAEAQATAGEKASVAIGNLKEQIGTALLPVVDKMATLITTKVVPAISTFVGFLQKNPQIIYGVAAAIGALAVVLTAMFIAANTIPIAIAAVIAGLVYAYTKFETFRKIVNAVVKFIVGYVKVQFAVMSAVFRGIWSAIKAVIGFFKSLWTNVRDFVGKVVSKVGEIKSKITGVFKGAKDWLKDVGKDIINGLINGIKSKFNDVKNTLGNLTGKLTSWKGPASLDKVILKQSGQYVVDGFITGLESRYPTVQSSLSDLTGSLTAGVQIPAGVHLDASVGSSNGNAVALPIDLSDASISRLADAILAGASRVANGLDDRRDFTNTVKSRTPGAYAGSTS